MKKVFVILTLVLAPVLTYADHDDILCNHGSTPPSDNNARAVCEKAFFNSLKSCLVGFNMFSYHTNMKATKACIKEADVTLSNCLTGSSTSTCTTACQTTYNSAVSTCDANFDPTICNGDATCQSTILAEQDSCVASATTSLNSCTTTCTGTN